MRRYFIRLSYNGTNYHGWQIQENALTVQAEINEKLSLLLNEEINVVGCGRTDTGVHAREFYAHFDTKNRIEDPRDLTYRLDRFLPIDIVIQKIFKVPPDKHARYSAISRLYKYYISRVKNPFLQNQRYFNHGSLDVKRMNDGALYLMDQKDFTSFSKSNTQTNNNNCMISEARWEEIGNELIFTIKADRFLRNMVRAIVGTLIEVGQGKMQPGDIKRIIEDRDRTKAGFSVPAEGLFLEKVEYDFFGETN